MNSSIFSFKTLVVPLIAAAATLAALTGASEWLVRTHAAPHDAINQHIALFETTTSPYVAFGDSHIARGFAPTTPVVNLAYLSENFEKTAWKAKRYLNRMGSPQKVMLIASPQIFAPYRVEVGLADYPEIFGEKTPLTPFLSLSERYRPQLIDLWQSYLLNGGALISQIEQTEQGALLSRGDFASWNVPFQDARAAYRVGLPHPGPAPANEKPAKA